MKRQQTPKTESISDPEGYLRIALEVRYCQACGISSHRAQRERWPGLENHHICRTGRSDDRCNILRLCRRDHNLAEGLDVREGNVILPKLTLAICLTIKAMRDPENYNPDRLRQLHLRSLPDLEPIPEFLIKEWLLHRGG